MSFDLVVFDLDGTLVDSLPDITRALGIALSEVGRPALTADVVRGLVGEGVVRLAEKALEVATGGSPVTAEEVAARIRAIYQAEPCVLTRPFDGVMDTLAELRARGRRLAVLTNKPGEVTRPLLAALGIDRLLDAATGDGDGFPRKPHPAALHALMAKFAVPPDRTLIVGDGLPDMAAASAAGIAAAAALWGYVEQEELLATNPRFMLEDVEELLGIV